MTTTQDRITAYETKVRALTDSLAQVASVSRLFSTARLVLFLLAVAIAAAGLLTDKFSPWWGAIGLAGFIGIVLRHDKILRKQEQLLWVKEFYEDGLARLNHTWHGKGVSHDAYLPDGHLYAKDLDIFGKGSLFELMCTAQTASGEKILASWLTAPSDRATILDRQAAIQELTDNVQIREDIAIATRRMRSLLEPKRLNEWALADPQLSPAQTGVYRGIFLVLGILAIAAVISCFFSDFGLAILAGVGIIEWVVGRILRPRIAPILLGVEGPRRQLTVLSEMVEKFEKLPVKCPLLSTLKSTLFLKDQSASRATAKLGTLVSWLEQARNQIFAPIAFLLMWNGHFALSIEKWRVQFGAHIPHWLESTGNLEALCAVAGYAYEHPDYPFPQIVDGSPEFVGEALGHPLLPEHECVRNNITLGDAPQILVVSGSNMSGKSTFLRVIGSNAVLAMCGAPICGKSLRMTPFSIGSTIRVQDSLQRGTSRFYAEISTLKQIVELSGGTYPLLFLLDEIFHGTNSHDRTIGARAVIRELVNRGALGLVTTHDLALTAAADELGNKAQNVHFDDTVKDGLLHFDYSLKQGPVTRSNALELMRSVGLKV